MSTSSAYFCLFLAFIGTMISVFDPATNFRKMVDNKTSEEASASIEGWIRGDAPTSTGNKGCSLVLLAVIKLIYTAVIDPIAAISALVNRRGSEYVAIAALIVLIMYWIRFIYRSKAKKKLRTKKAIRPVVSVDGDSTISMVEEVDVIKPANKALLLIDNVFFALPNLYLWYLFFVSILSGG